MEGLRRDGLGALWPAAVAPPDRRKDLRAVTQDGIAHSAMVGLGETYLPAFALALGFSDSTAGMLATAPMFVGALLQLVTPAALWLLGSHRLWVVGCAIAQALSFAPLVVGAARGALGLEWLAAAAVLYWAAAFSAGAAWNSWMPEIVPRRIRARFFSLRTRWVQLSLAVSLMGGGYALHALSEAGHAFAAFGLLFGLAAAARMVSARMLGKTSDARVTADAPRLALSRASLRRFLAGSTGRLFAYVIPLQVAVYIVAPFFTPYMLQELELGYGPYMILTATSFAARIAGMPLIGRWCERHGALRLLHWSGYAVIPMAGLWLVSSSFGWLIFIQISAGLAWGAYELAVMLLLFDTLDPRQRIGWLSLYNVAMASGQLAGALIGVTLLNVFGADALGYTVLLVLSTAARSLTLGLLRRVAAAPPPDVHAGPEAIPVRTIAIRPQVGAIEPPVLAAKGDNGTDEDEAATPDPA